MKRSQRGMTLMSFVVVLAVVGFAAYLAMKLFPMYNEYYSVRSAMKGLKNEPGIANFDPGKIKEQFFRKLDISYSSHVKPEHVKITRNEKGGGWLMDVNYEIREPMVGNLDVVGKFHATENLTNAGDGS